MPYLLTSISEENEILISIFDDGIEPRDVIKIDPDKARGIMDQLMTPGDTISIEFSPGHTETITGEDARRLRLALGDLIQRFE